MRFHQFDTRVDPAIVNMNPGLTPLQGRVAFHQERIFRSTGGGLHAHQSYVTMAKAAGLPTSIAEMSRNQCREALRLIELAARIRGLALFRNVRTGWEGV
jgi:hypothetical protein